jgi:putative methionine-R-sulfoxide reductase with GAF domain
VPVLMGHGSQCAAVLDVDSDLPAAFDKTDQQRLEELCAWLNERYFGGR